MFCVWIFFVLSSFVVCFKCICKRNRIKYNENKYLNYAHSIVYVYSSLLFLSYFCFFLYSFLCHLFRILSIKNCLHAASYELATVCYLFIPLLRRSTQNSHVEFQLSNYSPLSLQISNINIL